MAELVWKGKTSPLSNTDFNSPSSAISHIKTIAQYTATSPHTASSSITAQWQNRLIFGDKADTLPVLLTEYATQIDLIYIDPPFMTGRTFASGSQVAYKDTWGKDIDAYLQWLYETLMYLYKLLAEDGSLYIHLDWRTTHYAKVLLDEIFQETVLHGGGFRNEIIWHYQSGGRSQKGYARKHDTILLYTKSSKACFHGEKIGERRGTQKRNNMRREIDADGRVSWTIRSAGRVYRYSEDSLMTPSDVWSDIHHLHQRDPERTGYATQKPEALLERIITASSEEGGLVLDCFCGSGVTPFVAERLKRRWLACDASEVSIETTRERLLTHERFSPFVVQQIVK